MEEAFPNLGAREAMETVVPAVAVARVALMAWVRKDLDRLKGIRPSFADRVAVLEGQIVGAVVDRGEYARASEAVVAARSIIPPCAVAGCHILPSGGW